ncbi:DUF4238 domain-containing protein [Ancylobacter defluvii]|uniref:DUF4238 domain-containing protein n=1 Tax=Ancylobacter defluvii TaxID=1282440 RepID=UPI001BCE93C6|nr:DUF4238 domain-containing protein [Ancylobacter defluvii]
MADGGPKKHHFVPQMLLRRFADSDEKFHHFSRHRVDVAPMHIGNVFCQNHLYALQKSDDERDITLEKAFGEMEGIISPFLDLLVPSILSRNYPNLRQREREALAFFSISNGDVFQIFTNRSWESRKVLPQSKEKSHSLRPISDH